MSATAPMEEAELAAPAQKAVWIDQLDAAFA